MWDECGQHCFLFVCNFTDFKIHNNDDDYDDSNNKNNDNNKKYLVVVMCLYP
jgi:hypothetical protein